MTKILLAFFSIFSLSSSAVGSYESIEVVSFGDSISRGVFSNTLLLPPILLAEMEEQPVELSLKNTWISKLLRKITEKPQNAWSTGSKIGSVFKFLKGSSSRGDKFHPDNFAVSGATSEGLLQQAINFDQTNLKATLGTILIGGNDVCKTDEIMNEEKFQENLENTLDVLLSRNLERLIILDIPNVDELFNYPKNRMVAGIKCEDFWNSKYFYCSRIKQNVNPVTIQEVKDRVSSFQTVLEEVIGEYMRKYPNRIKYYKIFDKLKIEPSILARDCFHPNYKGQEAVAKSVQEKILIDIALKDPFYKFLD